MLKVAVFGASVSAQVKNHKTGEVTGYSEVLRLQHKRVLGVSDIQRITYPGNRLSDGGMLRLHDVLAAKPDICLFEPLIEDRSRGVRSTDDEICYVYASLIEAGILPVTIMLPIPEQRKPELAQDFGRYNAFCTKHNLPVIKVSLTHIGTLEGRFKGIHTTSAGAEIYANQIVAGLKALGAPASRLAAIRDMPKTVDIPVLVAPLGIPFRIDTEFQLYPKSVHCTNVRLVQLQDIGPFSPVLDVEVQRLDICAEEAEPVRQSISIWDWFCHYQRRSFVTLANVALQDGTPLSICVKISDTDPDYASCRREVAQWPAVSARKLVPAGPVFLVANGPVEVRDILERGA